MHLQVSAIKDILNAEVPNFKAVAMVVALATRAGGLSAQNKLSAKETDSSTNPKSGTCSVM